MNSHLPTLNLVCSVLAFPMLKVPVTFEFGCGEYSTSLFAERAEKHYAVELYGCEHDDRSQEWCDKMRTRYLNHESVSIDIMPYESAIDKMASVKPDVVFVDGPCFRVECVNAAFHCCHTVIAHDTEAECYGWERVEGPGCRWTRQTRGSKEIPDPLGAWTTIWTRNLALFDVLCDLGLDEQSIPRDKVNP